MNDNVAFYSWSPTTRVRRFSIFQEVVLLSIIFSVRCTNFLDPCADVLKVPYNRVVAQMLLKLANRKPTCHFRSLKHIVGKNAVSVNLHRFV